ncbi:uncharacterized protein LOC129596744 [Paramacrobiotus metropolitanus]|uniref:uncharacterized protein LOC129596744 n=1 Tax=Paramacrobiotus metropolitanus TaxID=2943436 RepID=UPI0024458336|nr:uncharacterized protein LOC129596744 [Paramacrobiotus metropolitanus]
MASQGTAPQTTKARFSHWIHGILRVDHRTAARKAITDDSNCRQILGKILQPVVCEFSTGQFSLGYLCGVDWVGHRVLVDFACHNRSPQWQPVGKVLLHEPVNTREIRPYTPVIAALRPNSDQPYVFQPARVIFPPATDSCGDIGPVCVETALQGGADFIRKFVHPVQVRVVAEYRGTDESLVAYCRLLLKQTARLDSCPGAANLDLRNMLRDFNKVPWITVVRMWLDTEGIHCIYTERKPGALSQAQMEYFVRKSKWRQTVQLGLLPHPNSIDTKSTNVDSSMSLGTLPYELHEGIMLQIHDIHSVVSAQKVCKTWHDILKGRHRSPHVAVDLTNLLLDDPTSQEQKYSRTHLVNILDNTVTTATVSLTLANGNLTPELDLYLFQFLSIKVTWLPIIILKNIRCFRALTQNFQTQRLEFVNLKYLMQACQVLRLHDVTVPNLFGPIAGLWCTSADFGDDVDAFVEKAALCSGLSETDRLRCFLQVLDAGCPELSPRAVIGINEACRRIITRDKHPLHSRLLVMLTLMNKPIKLELQPPLCRLAGHAFRYSYPMQISTASASRHQIRSVSRDPRHMDDV